MKDPKKSFGQKMRKLRKIKGLSQEKLAEMSGLDRTYIGSVERGERNISLLNIFRIAESLKTRASVLLEFKDLS
jgi:transcriptional regulator with XRE-family HTH domain